MQDYKAWVGRWLGVNGPGGRLAKLIHEDDQFPMGGDKAVLHKRLRQLNADEGAMVSFLAGWKHYEDDVFKKPRESALEKKLVHEVEKRGGLCWKFTSPGTVGVPDRIVLAPWGKVAFVEMKATGKKLRPIQQKRADEILDRGVPCYCLSSNQDILVFLQEMFGDAI